MPLDPLPPATGVPTTAYGRLKADLSAPNGGEATGVFVDDLAKALAVVDAARLYATGDKGRVDFLNALAELDKPS